MSCKSGAAGVATFPENNHTRLELRGQAGACPSPLRELEPVPRMMRGCRLRAQATNWSSTGGTSVIAAAAAAGLASGAAAIERRAGPLLL